jgi:hypothetical protein
VCENFFGEFAGWDRQYLVEGGYLMGVRRARMTEWLRLFR